jgi:hypothetical protein
MINGFMTGVKALVTSNGVTDANKIVSTNATGRLDESLMPDGFGVRVLEAKAFEALAPGDFVHFQQAGAGLVMRKASNDDMGTAHGFVLTAVAKDAKGKVNPLGGTNVIPGATMTVGAVQWLGTGGKATETPLDATVQANFGKINQKLGIAISATEIDTQRDTIIII